MTADRPTSIPPEVLASISTPDRVETRIGTLEFFDGLPSAATVTTVYDHLDLMRGVEVFLEGIPAASLYAMRTGQRSVGAVRSDQVALIQRMTSETLYLTANTDTTYGSAFLDLSDGPMVVEVPPNALGFIDDFWFRWVADLGNAGPDHGKGGKYLLLPPDWDGEVPEGFFMARSTTLTNWLLIRALDGEEALRNGVRIRALSTPEGSDTTEFVVVNGLAFNTVHANDLHFYEEVAAVVEEEPLGSLDPETRGLLASIGIVKGRPFAPDERMRRILTDAVAIGNATARAIAFKPREPKLFYHPGSSWKMATLAGTDEFLVDGARHLDARTLFFYIATGISPAMNRTPPGVGSRYAWTAEDADGAWLDGGRTYRLHLPAGIPVRTFWSVSVYDTQTRSLLQTDNLYPSLSSLSGTIQSNPDGSVDVHVGPTPPAGGESNWIQTVPGKGWFTILRLYGPLQPWFDGTWRPGEIERVG